jgi:hypothetical protein
MRARGFGIAALACLAGVLLGAAVAQGASFTAGSYPASIEGRQGGEEGVPPVGIPGVPVGTGGGGGGGTVGSVFGFEGKLMASCSSSRLSAELSGPSSSLTVTPKLSECAAFGFLAATFTPNGCQYVLNLGEEGAEEVFSGTMDITCPAGKTIVITQGNCEVQIGPQSGKALGFQNLAAEPPTFPQPAIALGLFGTGLTYEKTKDGAFCPLSGTGAKSDGVLQGGFYMTAAAEGEPVAFEIE